jgi:hypothetical protein
LCADADGCLPGISTCVADIDIVAARVKVAHRLPCWMCRLVVVVGMSVFITKAVL